MFTLFSQTFHSNKLDSEVNNNTVSAKKMASWSAENATKAYLKTLKMGKRGKEPDESEFISALAAGNNAQLIVVACANAVPPATLLALTAAAQQTGGRIICILQSTQDAHLSKQSLPHFSKNLVQYIVAENLISNDDYYNEADFVLFDCNIENHDEMIRAMQASARKGAVVVGFNAFCRGDACEWSALRGHVLPIGAGLLISRISENKSKMNISTTKRSHWVVKVDKCTGEEHVFRLR